MKKSTGKKIVSGLLALLPLTALQAQCISVGTGADGAYSATSNTTLAGGTYNFTTFNINSGVTVSVTGNQPLVILCTGAVTIDGSLVANGGNGTNGVTYTSAGTGGIGVAGGSNGGDGSYSVNTGPLPGTAGQGTGGANNQGDGWSGGGGAGYATAGASSGNSSGGFGGPAYGTANISTTVGGSGGGGGSGGYSCGSGGGGAGGGYISIASGVSITIGAGGMISCNGGNGGSDGTGNCGGGGGGSGGSIWLSADAMTVNGSILAVGGTGGASSVPGSPYYGTGASGADGRIRLDYNNALAGSGTITPAVGSHNPAPAPLQSTMSSTPSSCNGSNNGTATATVSGGTSPYSYSWSPSVGTGATISGLAPGTYTCAITDAVGCVLTETVLVVEPAVFTASIVSVTNTSTCFGGDGAIDATVSGGTAPYSFAWSNGYITEDIMNLSIGYFTLYATDANGCTATTGTPVGQPAPPVVTLNVGIDTACQATTAPFALTGESPSGGTFSGAAVSGGMFDPMQAALGNNIISYSYTDPVTNCSATATDTIWVDVCSGMYSQATLHSIFATPNPNNGQFSLDLGFVPAQPVTVEVMNSLGQRVSVFAGTSRVSTVDLSGQENGIYTLRIIDGKNVSVIRVVKQ